MPRKQSQITADADIADVDTWRCTDVLFLFVFIIMWLVMAGVAATAYVTGDLTSIQFGSDYLGNRCGVGEYADRPVVWYPRMSQDLGSQIQVLQEHPSAVALYGLCLDECPTRPHGPIEDYGFTQGAANAKCARCAYLNSASAAPAHARLTPPPSLPACAQPHSGRWR